MGQVQSGLMQMGGIGGLLNKGQLGLLKDIPLSPLMGNDMTAQLSAVLPDSIMGVAPGLDMEMGQPDLEKILANKGRYGDQVLGHLAPGEVVIPKKIAGDPEFRKKLEDIYGRYDINIDQFTVGNPANSINPNTGIMEYGFLSDLWGDIKKNAPTIGHIVGFAFGGPIGATIGGAVGGLVKEGDLGYAAKQAATGFQLSNVAAGAGITGGTFGGGIGGAGLGLGTAGTGNMYAGKMGGIGDFYQNLGANASDMFTGGSAGTPISGSWKDLSKMEQGTIGLMGASSLGAFEDPVTPEREEPSIRQNPQIIDYMNQGMGTGQAGSLEGYLSGPERAQAMYNQTAGLVPTDTGIENSALLNYLESMRRRPVAPVMYPTFEAI